METTKPSARMVEFKEYLRTRKKEHVSTDKKPSRERDQPKARGKRDMSDDEEWTAMDTSTRSPTTTTAPSPTESAASMTALLNRVLNQAEQHPGTTRALNHMIQMVREQWTEVNKNSLDMIQAKACTEKDPELTKLAVRMRR